MTLVVDASVVAHWFLSLEKSDVAAGLLRSGERLIAPDLVIVEATNTAWKARTFGDVPLSDPAFQYIEALAASGITSGCGGGNYCPDNPLTRRQMAVFLSKALGLHWPN